MHIICGEHWTRAKNILELQFQESLTKLKSRIISPQLTRIVLSKTSYLLTQTTLICRFCSQMALICHHGNTKRSSLPSCRMQTNTPDWLTPGAISRNAYPSLQQIDESKFHPARDRPTGSVKQTDGKHESRKLPHSISNHSRDKIASSMRRAVINKSQGDPVLINPR